MIKSKNLNITNNNLMTTHKINKFTNIEIDNLTNILKEQYQPNHAYKTFFSKEGQNSLSSFKNNIYKKAAVLCILLPCDKRYSVETILTVRSKKLKNHSGQISFPGGKLDMSDKNLIDCSIRETYEEIGIEKSKIQTIGMMNKYITGTGFLVTPVLATLKEAVKFNINMNEVDKVIYFPLKHISDKKNVKKSSFCNDKKDFFYYDFEWRNHRIWGTTALILYDINQILNKLLTSND